ncbi:hypothetical protein Tsubulata_030014 [Turnera subulata]|uniref:DNA sliding clamp PCNA n=1 Tax=Turnera subulata TaxID=218843 RepID=A0A9Q0G2W9_9ROSI|nr:hypothetical protein Tsubulata_030014 [Turnera subulata]
MLELRLVQSFLKNVLEATKDLVNVANFDCSSSGLSLQAVDPSRMALVALLLPPEGFHLFRCDRNISLGMNLGDMAKMLNCAAGEDDIITIQADDGSCATVTFILESPTNTIMVPDSEYQAIVRMPSAEFAKICKDLATIGDTVVITVREQGVRFSTTGDTGSAGVLVLKQKANVDNYMSSFTRATPLSGTVTISLSSELPAVVEYNVAKMGYIRFYLAPNQKEDEDEINYN